VTGVSATVRRKIAIFDYKVVRGNPIGGCHLRMLEALCREHDFTVFAAEFDNPCPERIRFVRIPAPTRPLALLFVSFHALAALRYWLHRLTGRARFDLVQTVESNGSFGDVTYSQFCHRAYLKHHWKSTRPTGLRGVFRWLDHRLHALLEPWVYRRVKRVVVASHGLARELAAEYPFVRGKITVISNPVDLARMRRADNFDRDRFRSAVGARPGDLVLVFAALGHFERKGLPLLLEALCRESDPRLKLVAVGGASDLVAAYRARADRMGLAGRVLFAGMQKDVRPFFWAADGFAFPSSYEVFPLVCLEAAAAGLPLLVPPLYGVEEFMRDGETGLLLERSPEGVAGGLRRLLALSASERAAMGERARASVMRYGIEPFADGWRAFYRAAEPAPRARGVECAVPGS
jgi:glycosyltransferase involved in cell wall biosynthesis